MKFSYGIVLLAWLSFIVGQVSSTAIPGIPASTNVPLRRPQKDNLEGTLVRDTGKQRRHGASLSRIQTFSKQVAVHMASSGPILIASTPTRIIGVAGMAAVYCAANIAFQKSEAAQRACFFWKRAGPIVAHYKFTQWWLTATKAPLEKRNVVYKRLHDRYCAPSLDIVLNLKGLYVKMGQVMSSRSDFMPVQYVELFSTLQDSVPQWPVEDAIEIIRESLKQEWGVEYEDVFETMDPIALGCAAIGQVHKAELKEEWVNADPNYNGGKQVAVKIMHPEAKQRFACDFQVFKWLTRVAMPGWRPLLDELERRLMTEFDYHHEADNQLLLRSNLMKSPYKSRVRIPQPYMNLCCKHVLVMEMLNGHKLKTAIEMKLSRVVGGNDKEKVAAFLAQRQKEIMFGIENPEESKANIFDLLDLHGIRGVFRGFRALALYKKLQKDIDLLVDVHGHQIFQDAAFNADPHPGNILELSDGRLGLIDFGQTKKLDDDERLAFAKIVVELGSKGHKNQTAEAMRLAGFQSQFDHNDSLAEYAALFFDSDFVHKEKGYATPQHYFQSLMATDPLITIPDSAIMVARVSLLFRGAGSAINHQVQTSNNWLKHANQALQEAP